MDVIKMSLVNYLIFNISIYRYKTGCGLGTILKVTAWVKVQ